MKQKPLEPNDERKPLFPLEEMDMPTTSDMDMTGLIPAEPADHDAIESYNDIYPYLPPVLDHDQM